MRENTRAIRAHATFKHHKDPNGNTWGMISFPSPRAAHAYSKEVANTPNETGWGDQSGWIGLDKQSREAFQRTGIAEYPLQCVQKASGALEEVFTRPANPAPSIVGSRWSTPKVLANLPKAAMRRPRKRLAPVTIKIAMFLSASITAESMAPPTAKIAKAIHAYTLAGGVVTLTMYHCGLARKASEGEKGFIVETKVPCNDLAQLSLALSPAYYRAVAGRLQTAFSDSDEDSIYPVTVCPIKDALFIGGSMGDVYKAAAVTLAALKLED